MGRMDDRTDGQMNDETDGWNDASRRPLLYVMWDLILQILNNSTMYTLIHVFPKFV